MSSTFGVTEEMIEEAVYGLDIPIVSDSGGPISSTLPALIARKGGLVSRLFTRVGITVSNLSSTSEGYYLGQELVLNHCLVFILRGRDHTFTLSEQYRQDVRDLEAELKSHPSMFGESQSTATNAPDLPLTHVQKKTQIDNNRTGFFKGSQDSREI